MYLFAEIERCRNAPDEFIEPEVSAFVAKDHSKSWLMDRRARDQFAMFKGEDVGIYFHNKGEFPEAVSVRPNWSQGIVQFSSQGTYFATVHKQGVAIYAGSEMVKLHRYEHQNVKKVQFSPKENYLVTWSETGFKTANGDLHVIIVD